MKKAILDRLAGSVQFDYGDANEGIVIAPKVICNMSRAAKGGRESILSAEDSSDDRTTRQARFARGSYLEFSTFVTRPT